MDAQDWSDHYDGIYDVISVSAVLTVLETGTAYTITVLDKTTGAEVLDGGMLTVKPVADVRMTELSENSLTHESVNGATLVMNGLTYIVRNHLLRPSPAGESPGECRMILSE